LTAAAEVSALGFALTSTISPYMAAVYALSSLGTISVYLLALSGNIRFQFVIDMEREGGISRSAEKKYSPELG